ncbi:MAG: hypothetical protein ABIQ47_03660 [Tepidiformaceae bacterium]
MRSTDASGLVIGYVREVSGRSILVKALNVSRAFWISADSIVAVEGNEVRLTVFREPLADTDAQVSTAGSLELQIVVSPVHP